MSQNNDFEESIRSILREAGRSAERAAHGNVDALAAAVGVEPARARQWLEGAAAWLRASSADADEAPPAAAPPRTRKVSDPAPDAGPHPLDTPTAEQGVALSALESGRWSVEPGSDALSTHGHGPGPIDAIGLFGALRARDWITAQGAVTVVGRHALTRWLEASGPS